MSRTQQIADQQAEPVNALDTLPSSDDAWPDKHSRMVFEAQMLRHHAETLERRYPATIWPTSGGVSDDERSAHAAQAAFVAGIRFAASQLLDTAVELAESVAAVEQAVERAS